MDIREAGRQSAIKSLMMVDRGAPMIVTLTKDKGQNGVVGIYAVVALYRRGLPLVSAGAAIEEMQSRGCTAVLLPKVEDDEILAGDLEEAGCIATFDDGHAGVEMLARIRTGLRLSPDLPMVIPTEGIPLQ